MLFPAGCRRGGHRASSCPAAGDARGCGTPRCRFGEVCPCHRPSRAQHRAASFFLKGAACGGSAAPEAERGLGGLLRSWKEKGLRCCPAAAAWSPARPAAPPAARLEAVGEKGHFPGCSSSCSHRTLVLGEGSGIQDGSGVFRESFPCVLQSLWPGRCPKEAAVRVAVERETEARSLTGIRLPPLLPGRVAAPRGGGLGSGAKLPGPRGAGAEPKVWGGRRVSLSSLSSLGSVPTLCWCPSGGGRRGRGKFFQDFHGFFQPSSPDVNPRSTVGCPGEREFYRSPFPLPQPEHFVPSMKGLPLSSPARDRCSCHADFSYLSPTQNLLLFLLAARGVGETSLCSCLEPFPASGLRHGRERVSRIF